MISEPSLPAVKNPLEEPAVRTTRSETEVTDKKRPILRQMVVWMVAVSAVAFGFLCLFPSLMAPHDHRATLPLQTADEPATTVVHVTTGTVQTRTVLRTVDVVGTLYGYEEVVISANVEGRVARLMVDVADRVPAGAQLAEIDPTNYVLAVRQAQRALDVELARVGRDAVPPKDFNVESLPMIREALSRLNLARLVEQRAQQLSKSKAVTAQELEAATADLQSSQATYDNQLLQAHAAIATLLLRAEDLDSARQQLQDTVILAPVPENPIPYATGATIYAVSARNVSEGTFARVGSEVFKLVIDDALRLRVAVPERHLGEIAVGQSAEVKTSAYNEPFLGQVTRINPVIEANTRTFEVEILLDNSTHRLKPGGFAKAKIITSENDTAITVPLESVTTFAGVTKIFLVENDQAVEVQVKLGQQDIDWVEIVSPSISPGATVVTSGQSALSQGTAVVEREVVDIALRTK